MFLVETAAVVGLHLPAGSSSLKPPSFSGLGPNQNRGVLVVGADPTEPHFLNWIYSSPFLDTRHSYCEARCYKFFSLNQKCLHNLVIYWGLELSLVAFAKAPAKHLRKLRIQFNRIDFNVVTFRRQRVSKSAPIISFISIFNSLTSSHVHQNHLPAKQFYPFEKRIKSQFGLTTFDIHFDWLYQFIRYLFAGFVCVCVLLWHWCVV